MLLNCIALCCVFLIFCPPQKKVCFVVEVTFSFGLLPSSQVASLPESQEEKGEITSVYSEEMDSPAQDDNKGTDYFVLEESSGYMEPSLRFLAVAHTIISFCCIIGYYCLKVYQLEHVLVQIYNELISFFPISLSI